MAMLYYDFEYAEVLDYSAWKPGKAFRTQD
jgi:hypothetical protein